MINLIEINPTLTKIGYDIPGVGTLTRVSDILSMVNFANLDSWKQKIITAEIIKTFKSTGDIKLSVDTGFQEPKNILKEAGRLGTKIHSNIENYLTSKQAFEKDNTATENAIFDNVRQWLGEWDIARLSNVKCEYKLYSKKHEYAGCADWLATDGDKLYLFDWKTSNHFSIRYYLQLAAYWRAIEEMNPGVSISSAYIVVFSKKVGYQCLDITKDTIDYFFDLFLCCLKLKRFVDANKYNN